MNEIINIKSKVAIVTGGSGLIGGSMAKSLARAGVKVALTYRNGDAASKTTKMLNSEGMEALAVKIDVLDEESIKEALNSVLKKWGKVDILINAAGGHVPEAVVAENQSIFDTSLEGIKKVMDINLFGTVIPTLIIGKEMANQGSGSIINISSMASTQSISRVLGYSLAKAGIDIFTKWMAMEVATKYGDGIRVNAISPGFFISAQNKNVLINENGNHTERAKKIINKTPMARFGDPEELNGIVHYLCSDASKFVTGTVIPIDGGFSSFSGV